MNQTTRVPLLTIPTSTESATEFTARIVPLMRSESTHIYIDTSFLMWMTKIGSTSRQELANWLRQNCTGRIHVPIWAAHEYIKHHIAGTIIRNLDEKISETTNVLGNTYQYFRPFIDEPFGSGSEDPAKIRSSTLVALSDLKRLISKTRQWRKSYRKHAGEVVAFINDLTPEHTTIYSQLKEVTQVGEGRFTTSIPPGYRDRRKEGNSSESSNLAPVTANRYGDLIFWKEVLLHARRNKAEALVVLTNDRKTDWYMGASSTLEIDPSLHNLRKNWKPVPRPHPMLVTEARLVASVDTVELLDNVYLAAALRTLAKKDELSSFVDVALVPDDPERESDRDARTRIRESREAKDAIRADAERVQKGYLFSDASRVLNSRSSLLRALFESRTQVDTESKKLLEHWRAAVEGSQPLSQVIFSEVFQESDHRKLARLARESHDRVLAGVPGYERLAGELLSILDILPLNTAASFFLGLLSSMYLLRDSNASRIPPSSPVAQLLFERQSRDYATNAIFAVTKRLRDNEFSPLYQPDTDCPPVPVRFDIEANSAIPDQLSSLKVWDVELLTPAQRDNSLRLRALFDENTPLPSTPIVHKACELFSLPVKQIRYENPFDRGYWLSDTIGFRRPVDIRIPKESSNGK